MKRKTLKLHKVKIVKLTHVSKILGGSENSETTYTTTGNNDSTTVGPTSAATSNGMTYCESLNPEHSCYSNTNDTVNGNNSVPTFNQTIVPEP